MINGGFVEDALSVLRNRAPDKLTAVLAAAGMSESELAQPDFELDTARYGRLWLRIAREIQCEFFGFGLRPMPPGSFAMMGHAAISCDNLEHAIRRSLRFFTLLIGEPKGELIYQDNHATIILREVSAARSAFAYRTYFLILYGLLCWLVKRRLPISAVGFRGAPPLQREDYQSFFGTQVRFFQPETSLSFDPAVLGLKIHRSTAALRQFLAQAPANILLRYRYANGKTLAVHQFLRATPPANWPDFAELAKNLHISEPTLRRHLQADGTSYSTLKQEIRRHYACVWLKETDKSVGTIATELGFTEPSAFHRAFRQWTATTPANYRSQRNVPV